MFYPFIITPIQVERRARWYFGGLASAGATFFTHPLDLIKVMLQTQQVKVPVTTLVAQVMREHGILAFYNGLSASVLRQLTYSVTRFGIYETGKPYINTSTFGGKVELATIAGIFGGIVGTPPDVVNVRMQNDVKLPEEQRRNYKNVFDGLFKVYQEEGIAQLFRGATVATVRGVLMTIGQIAFYDQIKSFLLGTGHFHENLTTHFASSLSAGAIATTLTQPIDVIKTRSMTAKPGEFKNLWEIFKYTASLGPAGFFKGFLPSFIRIGPHTILLFLILEQMRLRFGYIVDKN